MTTRRTPMSRFDKYYAGHEAICRKNNVPVLNMYEELGIDPNRQDDCEKYTGDGLHFNDAGHNVIGKLLASFLRKL